ncbi:hypothetical protein R1flu_025219 [Riccia fluitans]|uniref:Phosphodiesterase n=1 Tax=Riccia fluitans TaxID=41844 RepID=A0ABD1XXB2_9MARC
MEKPDPEESQAEKQDLDSESNASDGSMEKGRRVPPLNLERAKEYATRGESSKTASDSEMLIKSELPHLQQPEFSFKPRLFGSSGQDSPELPEIAPTALSDEAVELILQGIDSWAFDIFQIDDENLPKMVEKIFRELGLFDNFPLDVRKVRSFIHAMVVRYQPNPYHNFRHACDVLHAVYLLLTLVEAKKKLSQLEIFALALAALCHDVDHPGLNNQFLVATYDPLALRYNDRAVLESHHAATCFITMRGNDSLNLLSGLSEEEQRHMRKLMIILILATDMGEHARILDLAGQRARDTRPFEPSPLYTPPGCLSPITSREEGSSTEGIKQYDAQTKFPLKVYRNPLSPSPPLQSTSDATLLIQLIIKCADISNVVKPFFLSKRWAALLLLEWFRQGEIEKQLGLPISKFMDREDPQTLMAMTCGCIDYIAKPMYELTAKFLARVHDELLVNLSFNRQLWNTFSTNGRRASETAKEILGPFAPPPIPKGEELSRTFVHAPVKLEGKLVATFSGQYLPTDSPDSKQGPLSQRSLVSVAEELKEDEEEDEETVQSMTNESSSLSSPVPNLGTEDHSSVQTCPKASSRASTPSPADSLPHMPKNPESPGVQVSLASSTHSTETEKILPSDLQATEGEAPIMAQENPLVHEVEKDQDLKNSQLVDEKVLPRQETLEVKVGLAPGSQESSSVTEFPDSKHSGEPGIVEVSSLPISPRSQENLLNMPRRKSSIMKLRLDEPIVRRASRVQFNEDSISSSKASHESGSIISGIPRPQEYDSDVSPRARSNEAAGTSAGTKEESSAGQPVKSTVQLLDVEKEDNDSKTSVAKDIPEEQEERRHEAPLSLLFGAPNSDDLLLPAKIGKDKSVSLVTALLPSANRLISDRNKETLDQMAFRSPAFKGDARGPVIESRGSYSNEGDLEKSSSSVGKRPPMGFWEALRTHPKVARLNRALESRTWNILLIVATLVALFIDDVVKGFLPKAADMYESHVLTACLILFLSEAALLCIFRERYFLSFFFWLDLLGSVTLIPLIIGITSRNLVIARTGRAAKTVTRFSKTLQAAHVQQQIANHIPVLRVLRFFGLFRDSTLTSPENEEEEKFSSKPSQLWTRLSELTSQKLILGVLITLIATPYFSNSEKDLAPLVSLNTLDDYLIGSDEFNLTVNRLVNTTLKHGYTLEYLGVKKGCRSILEGGYPMCQGIDTTGREDYIQVLPASGDGRQIAQEKFRPTEIMSVTSDSARAQAFYSIASTILVLLTLAVWCFTLSRDSNRLLIQPIERMVEFVKELAEDPVSFAGKSVVKPTGDKRQVMETYFVEAALVKIASLTKVALGDAGMDILSVNLKGSEFNPMLPGKKIRACFGFCDIRNFTDATECLQEDVMMFVNRIADVVHNKVVLHSGFPNKNIGDAFLIVWKKTVSDNTNKSRATSFADRALRAFLDIIQSIETSQSLAEFAKHPAIQKRYRIHMGFGLHVGWAIEGAIGSAHKVDPSYLSPHVNMASRLEAATKQYGVMLLISETVVAHLTKSSLRDSCRKLDRVTVKGSQDPMVLYTFDIPLFQQDLRGNPQEYRDIFEEAVDSYIDGDWENALERLQECQNFWPTDKPAQVLINFMASHNNQVPETWAGFRELTEK